MLKFLRNQQKSLSLRIVNFIGLSVVFSCLLLSTGYIKRELSYDKHNSNHNRIVRLTMQLDNEAIDGRIWGNHNFQNLAQIPEIEKVVRINQVRSALMSVNEKNYILNDFYMVSDNFTDVFDFELLHGENHDILQRDNQIYISESFAIRLFGEDYKNFQPIEVNIGSRQVNNNFFIVGIYKDMPETSHFRSNILMHLNDEDRVFSYTYLLLKEDTDRTILERKITSLINESEIYKPQEVKMHLMPLADIHLYSHNLREMSVNGNINYIYLIIGANVLLLIVVLFNLWLNSSLIFSGNRRYYQLLRLHGAPTSKVFINEVFSGLFIGVLAILFGIILANYIISFGSIPISNTFGLTSLISLIFITLIVGISILPSLKRIASTIFLNTDIDLKPVNFSYSNVKYMLVTQYAIVLITVILAFGINKQMNLVKAMQVGGNESDILVMNEQPELVQEKFALLKTELLKHTEIESVTACFQLPGDAIRDAILVKRKTDSEWKQLPVMVVGEDFLPFFRIPLIAGTGFSDSKFSYETEDDISFLFFCTGRQSEYIEDYVINRKALQILGFNTPEEAIGEIIQIEHQGGLGYFAGGIIAGVTDDFNYTGLYEETQPMIILQRNMFLHCIMVRFDPDRFQEAYATFGNVWNEVYPDYPTEYVFMNDIFKKTYRNELNAQNLVNIYSILCLTIATLGLIIFMAFIIKRRTKEIAIRKIQGANINEILRMLNIGFIRYIIIAFIIAIPLVWFVMRYWLQRFAYRTSLNWWVFTIAIMGVLIISIISVSIQSWRAATTNPVKGIAKN